MTLPKMVPQAPSDGRANPKSRRPDSSRGPLHYEIGPGGQARSDRLSLVELSAVESGQNCRVGDIFRDTVRDDRSRRDHPFVPTISRFFGVTIAMFFDDHGYPHFHARHAEGEAKVRIDNLEVIDSTLGRRQLRLVLAWAELHQGELEENWRRARAGETLQEIEPLR